MHTASDVAARTRTAADSDPSELWKNFVRRIGLMLALAGCMVFAYNYSTDMSLLQDAARNRARAHFHDILLTWHWNSDYGGVYVEKKPGIESSSLLEFPDIEAKDGKTYTLRDPDTMSREIAALARRSGDHSFHITSLKLKNPENQPDSWERKALQDFEKGKQEAFDSISENGTTLFRYMAPMYTERACLTCHSEKIYRIGQIQGGISVSFDLSEVVNANQQHQFMTGLMIVLAMSAVFFATRLFSRRLNQRLGQINRRYADLISSTESIVWEADASTLQIRFISEQVHRLLGYSPEEWLQAEFWMECIPPIQRETTREALDSLIAGSRPGPLRLDYPLVAKNGHVVWMQDVISIADTENGERLLHGAMLDITERKNNEQRNQQLLAEQDAIFRNVLVGIALVRERRIVSCNRRFEEIFGYGADELMGASTRQLYCNNAIFEDIGRRAYQRLGAGEKFNEETVLQHKNGHSFWGAITGQALDPEHPAAGSIWIYADITERHKAMEEANKLLRAVEQSPVSIIITDPKGVIEYISPRFSLVSGYSREEALGKTPNLLKSGEMKQEFYAELWSSLLQGKEWRGQLRNRCKNGNLIWEDASISPVVTETGKITHFIAVKEDITQRKMTEDALRVSENRLKIAMEVSNDGIWDWQIASGNIYLSHRLQLMLGYEKGEMAQSIQALLEHVNPPYRVHFQASLEECRDGSNESFETEFQATKRDGESLWILARVKVVERNAQGCALRLVATNTDITERIQGRIHLEEQQSQLEKLVEKRTSDLSQALAAAHAADRIKSEFLANVNHEIRTPLNAIIGLSSLALKNADTPRQLNFLEKISHAGQNLLVIVNDLLDLSKISAGRLELEKISFSLSNVIERVHFLLDHRLEESHLQLAVQIDPRLPSALLGDPLRIEQLLLNLLTNAIKFTPKGGIQLRFKQESLEGDLLHLVIEVEDSGIGLTEQEIDRLFQPFTQADTSITRTHGGTGLGLTICRRLVGLMGGHIGVTSTPGMGSKFTALILLQVAPDDSLLPQPLQPPIDEIRYKNTRVLIVDDVLVNREIVRELLKQVGIEFEEAGNGEEALAAISSRAAGYFELILMDIQMPKMDGHSAAMAIRQTLGMRELPIVAMTAHAMQHEKLANVAAGMNDHLSKPFDTDVFYALLARWIPKERQYIATDSTKKLRNPASESPIPNIPNVDTDAGLKRFAGNTQAYLNWLGKFSNEGDTLFAEALAALDAGHQSKAQSAIHSLKGRVGMLGMTSLWQATADLETVVRASEPHHDLKVAVLQELAQTIANLRRFLPANPTPDKPKEERI